MFKSHQPMKITKHFFLFIALIGIAINASAQIPGGKTKASDYSDAEIKTMIQKAESAGMSEGQVIQLAKARGMSDAEVEAFRARVNAIKNKDENKATQESLKKQTKTDAPITTELPKPIEPNTTKPQKVKPAPTPKPTTPSEVRPNTKTNRVATSWNIDNLFDAKRFPAFENGRSLRAPDQYIIGVGDEISVTVFGNSYFNQLSKVDSRGRIDLGASMGKVYVKGVAFKNLERLVKSALRQKISLAGNQVEIDLAFSRQLSINVTGEVQRPGTFQVPAANTVFNLLVLSGGPTKNGTIRDIEVIRGGKKVYRFDVYEYLINPQNNLFLEDGDFVVIKPVNKKVQIQGGVLRPGSIELRDGETLEDAIKFAGGFSTKADPNRMTLSRLNGVSRSVMPLNFENQKTSVELYDGDQIFVFEQKEEVFNAINIEGEVYFPGSYPLTKGLSVLDLLSSAGGLTRNANTEVGFVIRTYTDGSVDYLRLDLDSSTLKAFALQDKDKVVLFTQSYFKDQESVSISGSVRKPQSFPFKPGLTILDMIEYCGGLTPEANTEVGFVIRTYTDGSVDYLRLDLDSSTLKTFALQDKDKMVLFNKDYFKDKFNVEIRGEVRKPTSIPYKEGLTLNTLLEYAGGFRYSADVTQVEILRSEVFDSAFSIGDVNKTIRIKVPTQVVNGTPTLSNVFLHPTDIVLVRRISNLNDRIGVSLSGEVKHPGAYVLAKGENRVDNLLKQCGGFTRFAYPAAAQLYRANGQQVVFDLKKANRFNTSKYNYFLRDGDRIVVPTKPDVVFLPNTDTLRNNQSLIAPYSGGRAGYYMRNYSLGFDKDHLKRRLYVEHPGGQVKRSRHFGLFVLTPKVKAGSKIKFQPSPVKTEKQKKKEGEPMDWNKFFENLTTKLTAVATLWVLVSRI